MMRVANPAICAKVICRGSIAGANGELEARDVLRSNKDLVMAVLASFPHRVPAPIVFARAMMHFNQMMKNAFKKGWIV